MFLFLVLLRTWLISLLLNYQTTSIISLERTEQSLAKELGVALLAQIPIVQSICESGDAGEPAATKVDSITGQAFLSLAQSVITVVNRRNSEQEPTKIVKMHS